MTLRHKLSAMVIAVFVSSSAVRLYAAFPSVILIYGDSIQRPLLIPGEQTVGLAFLYPTSKAPAVANLEGRSFLSLALYWGGDWQEYVQNPSRLSDLKPDQANQRGRLYPPTATEPAVVLTTSGYFCSKGAARRGEPVPIPPNVRGFECGQLLSPNDNASLHRLGVPGF